MKKINFVNNDAPYLSAENLNQMQDNIEEAIRDTYSTEETFTGKYWFDGKKIYRKVIIGTTPSSNDTQMLYLDNVEELVDLKGFINSWESNRIPINSFSNTNDFVRIFATTINPLRVNFNSVSAYFNQPYKIIIEYTKTTD